MTPEQKRTFAYDPIVLEQNRPQLREDDLSPLGRHLYEQLSVATEPTAVVAVLSSLDPEVPRTHEALVDAYEQVLALGGLRIELTFPYRAGKSTVSPTIQLVIVPKK